jgi:RNA polymerase sigma-70 factor (ECF subfamily)
VGDLASDFEAERDHLTAVAYRMLGSRAEAEDAVQEAFLRYASLAPDARDEIRDRRGWLTTTTARICLDVLRSARVRRESYAGQWLPEPIVNRLPSSTPDPAETAARSDEVSTALLYVMERLTPEQRVAFVLHDAFAVPFEEIATALGTTVPAARQLASRARRAVADGGPRHTADVAQQRRVLVAFLKATESGDLEGLMAVLAPDVVFVGDGGGLMPAAKQPVVGALQVARFILGLLRRIPVDAEHMRTEVADVNGGLGIVVGARYQGEIDFRSVMSFAVDGDRITGVFNQLNPDKMARVPEPLGGDWPPPVS